MKRIALFTLAILLIGFSSWAAVSNTIQIQGVLTDDTGTPLADGDYSVEVRVFNAPVDGGYFYATTRTVTQQDGVFTFQLLNFSPGLLDDDKWMELTLVGESPMMPRIPILPVPLAIRATTVDPTGAVIGLNGKTGDVALVAGTNVTIVPSPSTNEITINADGGGGGADTDWVINGDDITHETGSVYVGSSLAKSGAQAGSDGNSSTSWPASSKMEIQAVDEGLSVFVQESTSLDGRASIYAERAGNINAGTGFGPNNSNAAIMGINDRGGAYTLGVSGYTDFTYGNSAGVLGSSKYGEAWGALAFYDTAKNQWGLFTPNNIHSGGLTETGSLRVTSGAAAGYIMTSDAAGNASWAPPSAAGSDGDWAISGANLSHSGSGTVTIGTGAPSSHGNDSSRTTFQILSSFSPALALDAWFLGNLTRWTMAQSGGDIHFNRSSTYSSLGTTAMTLSDSKVEIHDPNGDRKITLQTYDGMEAGSVIRMYGTHTTDPTLTLDSQLGSGGGHIVVHDSGGADEVIITSNHNNTGVGRVTTPVLEITGGADLSEQFDLGNASALIEPGMVVSIDPDNPGRLALSGEAYDRRVAGVISGAGGVNTGMVMGQAGSVADGDLPVALVGRVYVWADASMAPIEPGDLLTTADLPGHAMKVRDHTQAAGAILGKAMTGLADGQGLILTLVSLQ